MFIDKETLTITFDDKEEIERTLKTLIRMYEGCIILRGGAGDLVEAMDNLLKEE